MAITLSKNSQVSIGATAVGLLLSWDFDESDTQIDITTNDSTGREFTNLDLIDRNFNAEAQYDLSDTGQDAIRTALGGTAVAIVIYPDGNTTGKPELTATILVGANNVTAGGIEDVISATFSGKLTAITEGTVSA